MMSVLTKNGKLRKRFLPAIYFDSSVLIEYWMTEDMEMSKTEVDELLKKNELPHLPVVRNILRSETKINKVVEIRKKLLFGKVKVTPIVTPLSLLELIEWHAEASFKQIASEASGVVFIQKRSKKQIGDYLKKALKLAELEAKEQKGKRRCESTGLEILMSETRLNRSFAECHGLQGLLQVDIVNFHLPINKVWQESSAYAYLQLGIADIMHILLAQQLGCQYIASFDSDFARVKDIISEETKISVLTSPEEILAIL
ncbi:MAG: PIN domain-containing protein [Candidatus Aenigmarchaeota archaeon]|nr:PIN domain-containing protein [Candidatus Aenigmarchaeota archaeon]